MDQQEITIKWHPITEKPPKESRYLVAELVTFFNDQKLKFDSRIEVNERSYGRRGWRFAHGCAYAWAEKPKIEPPKPPFSLDEMEG